MATLAPTDSPDAVCPVLSTARIVSGKWTLLMLRDLAAGPRRFGELERSLEGISPGTLSLRLRSLEEEGILERHEQAEMPARVVYRLTEKGRDLVPIVDAMREYGRQWLADEDCAGR
jgi:DNA-binding HxlR family transcriptional regulator